MLTSQLILRNWNQKITDLVSGQGTATGHVRPRELELVLYSFRSDL